jgi:alpha-L-rhamnosidase
MHIYDLRTNHIVNPLGYDLSELCLSYKVDSSSAHFQSQARMEVALDHDFSMMVHDSGWRTDISSLGYRLQLDLVPRTRYFWRVSVEADHNEQAISDVAWFETAKQNEPWAARWIAPVSKDLSAPVFVKTFALAEKPIAQARAYLCGVGLYELYINQNKVGTEYLAPGCTAYDSWVQYQTYDVTEHIQPGAHHIEVLLGNGWYKGRFGFNHGGKQNHYGDQFELLAELVIRYKDGSEEVIKTDHSWRYSASEVGINNIYDGEHIDATHQRQFVHAIEIEMEQSLHSKLRARLGVPVVIHETMKPVQVRACSDDSFILDFGKNIVGWVEFDSLLAKGQKVFIQYAEILQDQDIYIANLRTAKAAFSYVSDGVAQHVRPHFTFYGFRYVKVCGLKHGEMLDSFVASVLYSDFAQTAELVTGHTAVNQFIDNVIRSHKGNFVDIPTDCPQRDERMGWTGDLQVFSSSACMNMDVYAFLTKYLTDVALEQTQMNGAVPFVVPMFDVREAGSCAWGDVATVVPWNMWLHYGDATILSRQYSSMKRWVDYIYDQVAQQETNQLLWDSGFHFGDWLALDNEPHIKTFKGKTEDKFIASIYYYYSTQLVAKAASVLGNRVDEMHYLHLSEAVLNEIRNEYMTSNGKLALDTQTAYILAIMFDVYLPKFYERASQDLSTKLARDQFKITSGFVGTPYFCRALTKVGLNDLAYRMFLSDQKPGWMYPVKQGATTIWERWDSVDEKGNMHPDTSMNSLNHYAFGSVIDWIYKDVCGLNPVESTPGFKRALIQPHPDFRLRSAKLTSRTASGLYCVAWEISDSGYVTFDIAIPFDCRAELVLPDINAFSEVDYRGESLPHKKCNCSITLELVSGSYRFGYQPNRNYIPRYNIEMPIRELLANEQIKAILEHQIPDVLALPFLGMLENESLISIAKKPFFHYSNEVVDHIGEQVACHVVV